MNKNGAAMGQSKTKKADFLRTHPFCCFCGGKTRSVTIDHVPNRACFLGRNYPETFEFPACSGCQEATRKDELAFAFYVRMMDRHPNNYDRAEASKAISGLANNLPHLLPNPYISGIEKRRKLNELGLRKPLGMENADIPIVTFHPAVSEHLERYGLKIACALFYREKLRPVPQEYRAITTWGQIGVAGAHEILSRFVEMTPFLYRGARPNLDFGDRFGYRCNKADEPDVFAAISQFGQGLFIASLIVAPSFVAETDFANRWITVKEGLTKGIEKSQESTFERQC